LTANLEDEQLICKLQIKDSFFLGGGGGGALSVRGKILLLIPGHFSVTNGTAFSRIFKREDNVAKYTPIFGNFSLGISVPFDLGGPTPFSRFFIIGQCMYMYNWRYISGMAWATRLKIQNFLSSSYTRPTHSLHCM